MKVGFEDRFMEIQAELVELCLEAVGEVSVTRVYIYLCIEDVVQLFNMFCETDGEYKKCYALGVEKEAAGVLLHRGSFEMIDKIRDLCDEYNLPCPAEVKSIYDVETGGFTLKCQYEWMYIYLKPNKFEMFEMWYDEVKAAKGTGNRA